MLCPDIANNNKGAVLRAAVSRALKSPPWACFLACEAGLSGQLAGGKGSGFLCLSHLHSSHFLGSQSSEKPWPNSPCPHWEACLRGWGPQRAPVGVGMGGRPSALCPPPTGPGSSCCPLAHCLPLKQAPSSPCGGGGSSGGATRAGGGVPGKGVEGLGALDTGLCVGGDDVSPSQPSKCLWAMGSGV